MFVDFSLSAVNLAKWDFRLLEVNFEVVHRAGIEHQKPDALSRLKTHQTYKINLDDELAVLCFDEAEEQHYV